MQRGKITDATVFVIFGGDGDLTLRKLVPALYSLFLDGWLPERFAILGVGRKQFTDDSYRQHLREGVDKFSARGKTDEKSWAEFRISCRLFECRSERSAGIRRDRKGAFGLRRKVGRKGGQDLLSGPAAKHD